MSFLKPVLGNLRSKSNTYYIGKLDEIFTRQSLKSIVRWMRRKGMAPPLPALTQCYCRYRCYHSEELIGIGSATTPISAFLCNNCMYVLHLEQQEGNSEKVVTRLVAGESTSYNRLFTVWQYTEDATTREVDTSGERLACVLLPCQPLGNNRIFYHVITENWN